MKRKLKRMQKRHDQVSIKRLYRETSPFFWFDASIRIGGVGKFHDAIFEKTGLIPSKVHLAGDKVSPRSSRVREEDIWIFSSPLERNCPIDDHVDWLLKAITPHTEYLSNVVKNSAWSDLFLGCLSDIPYPVISTSKSVTELMKRLDLTISFNFTCR
jgi:hypothetical protein